MIDIDQLPPDHLIAHWGHRGSLTFLCRHCGVEVSLKLPTAIGPVRSAWRTFLRAHRRCLPDSWPEFVCDFNCCGRIQKCDADCQLTYESPALSRCLRCGWVYDTPLGVPAAPVSSDRMREYHAKERHGKP